jgi:hypothetical protein
MRCITFQFMNLIYEIWHFHVDKIWILVFCVWTPYSLVGGYPAISPESTCLLKKMVYKSQTLHVLWEWVL